jgi:hypothetical protein
MLIQLILTALFALLLASGLAMARHDRVLGLALATASAAAVVPVWAPQVATELANALGVGRGTDLLLYLWFSISALLILALYLRLMRLQDRLTDLVRALALGDAARDAARGDGPNA